MACNIYIFFFFAGDKKEENSEESVIGDKAATLWNFFWMNQHMKRHNLKNQSNILQEFEQG